MMFLKGNQLCSSKHSKQYCCYLAQHARRIRGGFDEVAKPAVFFVGDSMFRQAISPYDCRHQHDFPGPFQS